MTAKSLRLLSVDESSDDTEIMRRALRRAGFTPDCVRVDSIEALRAALAGPAWDAITCDSDVPRLDTARVLEAVRDAWPTVPILIVSGRRLGEFDAALRSGLADGYINKDAIDDLAAVVRHLVTRRHPASSHCALGLGS